ncbi:hypothetical protein ACKA0G_01475 (plasmid) [Priestia megaterium]|uniref:hypothetical protein n=1 Tax=Priestia megaterium TaxID=1404 RepID=UPI00389C6594
MSSSKENIVKVIEEAVLRINLKEDLEHIDNGVKFEDYVAEVIKQVATPYGIEVEQTSAQSFPDIIIGGRYGIEIKYTKSKKWQSMGNSIFEGTLRKEVTDQIYIIFGRKSEKKIESRFKKYEECLSSIKVTHSPRFLIDMDMEDESTSVLNTIGITYKNFKDHSDEEKSDVLKRYVKSQLKEGETLWWMDSITGEGINPKIKEYRQLYPFEKKNILIEAFLLFPEIFSNSSGKYLGLAIHLLKEYQVVSSSLRDNFSAGGQVTIVVNNTPHKVGKIYKKLYENSKSIEDKLSNLSIEKLNEYWSIYNVGTIEEENKLDCWKAIIDDLGGCLPGNLKPSLIFEEGLKAMK